MATGTNPSGGTPSDPRELIFQRDEDPPDSPKRVETKVVRLGRLFISLAVGGLAVWFHDQVSEWMKHFIDPFVPYWIFYPSLGLTGLVTFIVMYRWLRPRPTDS